MDDESRRFVKVLNEVQNRSDLIGVFLTLTLTLTPTLIGGPEQERSHWSLPNPNPNPNPDWRSRTGVISLESWVV